MIIAELMIVDLITADLIIAELVITDLIIAELIITDVIIANLNKRSDYYRFHGVIVFILIICVDLYDFIRGALQFSQTTNINVQLNNRQ